MNMLSKLFALGGALTIALTGFAQAPAQGEAGKAVSPPPIIVPAVRVNHATHAMMLATAHAGSRLVAVGDHGVVLLSDDDGATYRQAREVPIDVPLTSVSFTDDRQGWAVGHWGAVLHTADGGETWRLLRSDTQQDRPLFAVHFFDARHGVAAGLWSLVLVTEDGGAHWNSVKLEAPEGAKRADLNLLGLFTDPQGHLYAPAEHGMVLRSDDQGQHWRYLNTGYAGSFWTGVATSSGGLIVAGLRGSMYRSVDAGQHWERIDTHSKSSITALAAEGDRIVGVGLDGLVLRSQDAGASVATEVRNERTSLTALALGKSGRPILFSDRGVVAGSSGGAPTR